ncbi:hypothetical protein M758_9G074200 [Ceratodon purpureus]|nr:hypothetical protein M758_9G074200 [Ceratodon purpureus]
MYILLGLCFLSSRVLDRKASLHTFESVEEEAAAPAEKAAPLETPLEEYTEVNASVTETQDARTETSSAGDVHNPNLKLIKPAINDLEDAAENDFCDHCISKVPPSDVNGSGGGNSNGLLGEVLEEVKASSSDFRHVRMEDKSAVAEVQTSEPSDGLEGPTEDLSTLDKSHSPCVKPETHLDLEPREEISSVSEIQSVGVEKHLVSESLIPDCKIGEHINKPAEIINVSENGTSELPPFDLSVIQISQWSLTHRIKVCKACVDYNNSKRQVMTPISRNEFAKQSLALANSSTRSDSNSFDASLSSLEWSDENWESKMSELHEKLAQALNIGQNWEVLTTQLEVKLKSVREGDMKSEWYNVFIGEDFQPWEIYNAVEEKKFQSFKDMMLKIGVEHWGLISPGEYRSATPLHWAALHGQENMVDFMKEEMSNWKADDAKVSQKSLAIACDEFGFTPLYMAIFSTPIIPGSSVMDGKRCSRIAATLCEMGGISYAASSNSHPNILIFTEATGNSRAYFVAKHHLTRSIHPLHLAIWFAHPRVIKKLMEKLKNEAFMLTADGDTILHLAAWGINKQHGEVMTLLLRYLYLSPSALNHCNKDKQTPLHIAVFQGKYECVAALFRCHHVEVRVRNKKGNTPLQIAIELFKNSCTSMNLAKRMFAWSLGREDVDGKIFGISTLNYKFNEEKDIQYMISEAYNKSRKAMIERIIDLIDQESLDLEKKILRCREILQISQWSIRHRILALWMFDDKEAKSELKTSVYQEQYWKLAETLCQGMDGFKEVTSGEQLRTRVTSELNKLTKEFLKPCSNDDVAKKLQPIYYAVEEEDLDEFKRKLSKLPKEHWSKSLTQYRGATLLHWAALHGRKEMVSFIRKEILSSDATSLILSANVSEEGKIWTAIKDAKDTYAFTPLHLAVFSLHSPWLKQEKRNAEKEDENAKNCAELIEELYQLSIPNSPNTTPCTNFTGWNLWDYRYADDHDLSNIELYPIHLGVWFAHPGVVRTLLKRWKDDAFVQTSKGDTILHCATWNDNIIPKKLKYLKPLQNRISAANVVNASNEKRQTPLHNAVHIKSVIWVEALLGFDSINVNLRNQDGYTPRELAAAQLLEDSTQVGHGDNNIRKLFHCFPDGTSEKKAEDPLEKIIYLIDRKDPAGLYRETETLQKERQVYVDAANAILVGAALIASASFGAWLQPPLGYKEYYSHDFLSQEAGAPPDTYEAFVAIKQYWIIHLFWIFNSLSFFFSLATVIAGADAALPQQGLKVKEAVSSVRKAVKLASWLLTMAILFVIGTFTTVGFAILPHIQKYRINMYCTLFIGLVACTFTLVRLLRKLSPNAGSSKSTSRKQQKCISLHPKPSRLTRDWSMVMDIRSKYRHSHIAPDT